MNIKYLFPQRNMRKYNMKGVHILKPSSVTSFIIFYTFFVFQSGYMTQSKKRIFIISYLTCKYLKLKSYLSNFQFHSLIYVGVMIFNESL